MSTNKLMIDLETLATTSDCEIIAIGAVVFDDEKVVDSLYLPLDFKHVTGRISGSALSWWFKQSQEAQQSTFGGERIEAWRAAEQLLDLIQRHQIFDTEGNGEVWANDPDFDIVALKHWWIRNRTARIDEETSFHVPAIVRPWPVKYNASRSYRTLRRTAEILGWTEEMNGAARGTWLAHNALDDAASQARAVIAMRQFVANHVRMSV